MDRADTLKILSVLRGAYPAFYRDTTKREAESIANLWADMFADDDYIIVAAAVKALIASDSKGYPPVIGQIKERIRRLTEPQEMTEAEAWALVSKAVKNGLYGSKEEFEKLPADIRRIVGSPNQLRDWAMADSDSLQTVVASNFQRSYRAIAKANKEYAALPGDVKKMIAGISKNMMLEAETRQGNNLIESR